MKNDAATKRAEAREAAQRIEDYTRNYTANPATRECSDARSSNNTAIRDNGSTAGTICDNELAAASPQKPMTN